MPHVAKKQHSLANCRLKHKKSLQYLIRVWHDEINFSQGEFANSPNLSSIIFKNGTR